MIQGLFSFGEIKPAIFLFCPFTFNIKCVKIQSERGGTPQRKGRKAMIKALVEYIGRNGKTIMKAFTSLEEAEDFTKKLDERIEKGTCGGYILTNL